MGLSYFRVMAWQIFEGCKSCRATTDKHTNTQKTQTYWVKTEKTFFFIAKCFVFYLSFSDSLKVKKKQFLITISYFYDGINCWYIYLCDDIDAVEGPIISCQIFLDPETKILRFVLLSDTPNILLKSGFNYFSKKHTYHDNLWLGRKHIYIHMHFLGNFRTLTDTNVSLREQKK